MAARGNGAAGTTVLYADGFDVEDGPEVLRISFWTSESLADETIERRPVAEIVISRTGFVASEQAMIGKFPLAPRRAH